MNLLHTLLTFEAHNPWVALLASLLITFGFEAFRINLDLRRFAISSRAKQEAWSINRESLTSVSVVAIIFSASCALSALAATTSFFPSKPFLVLLAALLGGRAIMALDPYWRKKTAKLLQEFQEPLGNDPTVWPPAIPYQQP